MVGKKAAEVAAEVVQSSDWEQRIEETIRAGFDDYLKSLRIALQDGLVELIHGIRTDSSYSSRWGEILGKWPKAEKECD